MLHLKRLVKEGKQVGKLYHVCALPSFIYDIENNKIEAGKASNRLIFVDGSPVFKQETGWADSPTVYYWIGKKPDNYRDYKYQDYIRDIMKKKGVEKTFISFSRDKRYTPSPRKAKYIPFIRLILDGDKISDNKVIRPYDFYSGYAGVYSQSEKASITESEELVESPLLNLDRYIIGAEIDPTIKYAKAYNKKDYGLTKTNLQKFVKLCQQHRIQFDESIYLIDAYTKVCEEDNLKLDDKLIQKLRSLKK